MNEFLEILKFLALVNGCLQIVVFVSVKKK
jgi:hypothetical protein